MAKRMDFVVSQQRRGLVCRKSSMPRPDFVSIRARTFVHCQGNSCDPLCFWRSEKQHASATSWAVPKRGQGCKQDFSFAILDNSVSAFLQILPETILPLRRILSDCGRRRGSARNSPEKALHVLMSAARPILGDKHGFNRLATLHDRRGDSQAPSASCFLR